MKNKEISNTQGDLNCILAKYLIENVKIEESEMEYLKNIVN